MIIDFSVILIVLSVVIILFIQNNMNIIILEMRYEHMQKEILKIWKITGSGWTAHIWMYLPAMKGMNVRILSTV